MVNNKLILLLSVLGIAVYGCSVSGLNNASEKVFYTAPKESYIANSRVVNNSPEEVRKSLLAFFVGGKKMDVVTNRSDMVSAVGYTENIDGFVDCGVVKRSYSSATSKNIKFEYTPLSTTQYLMAINGDGFLINSNIGYSKIGVAISIRENPDNFNQSIVAVLARFTIPQKITAKDKYGNSRQQDYEVDLTTTKKSYNPNNGITCISTGQLEKLLLDWVSVQ